MKRAALMLVALALLLGGVGQAMAGSTSYNYDFSNYYGESLSSLPGVGFSLSGGPGPGGTPYVGSFGAPAIGNSPTGDYPTSTDLVFSFTSPASGVSFYFSNFGDNSYLGGSYYDAYDASHNLVDSGSIASINGATVTVNGSDISTLVLDNGSGGYYSWEFGVYSLAFTAGAATPEPASLTLLGLGALGLAGYGYRRRKAAAV